MLAYWYAMAFAKAGWTLSPEQKAALALLRDLDEYPATKPFLFSDKIEWPGLENTDNLFKSTTITGILQQETGNESFSAYPNPFTNRVSFQISTENGGQQTIEIFDINGKLVKMLNNSISGQLIWDGLSASGNPVQKGIYFWKGKTGRKIGSGKLIKTE
jgi:hypothetical protein